MPQYLLTIIQPVGEVPSPEVLEPVMRQLAALNEEMQAAGAWVFAAALHQPETYTVVRAEGDSVLTTDGPEVPVGYRDLAFNLVNAFVVR